MIIPQLRRPCLHVEEHRLFVALQMDVEAIDRVTVARLPRRDQRRATVGRHQRQHGIGGVGSLAVEINPRLIVQEHAAREHGEHDMRGLRLAVGIGHSARLDGVEDVATLGIGADAAESLE